MVRAAEACRARGAVAVHAAATHGVFGVRASEALSSSALDTIVVTNSVTSSITLNKIVVLDVAELLAEAIRRIHSGDSLVELLES
jgi:ribose-phosphate pyrophosphokinase